MLCLENDMVTNKGELIHDGEKVMCLAAVVVLGRISLRGSILLFTWWLNRVSDRNSCYLDIGYRNQAPYAQLTARSMIFQRGAQGYGEFGEQDERRVGYICSFATFLFLILQCVIMKITSP